jgi:hypothetical protein
MLPALRALFDGLIDYAGLYPPAALPMEQALCEYAGARAGPDGWALNRLVVPTARLEELAGCLAGLPAGLRGNAPWRLAVTAGEDLVLCAKHAGEFAARQGFEGLVIEAFETAVRTPAEVERARAEVPAAVALMLELPLAGDLPALAQAVRSAGGIAKLRAGGVRAADIPPPAAVLAFLTACAAERLPFKATAGLHHAVRGPAPLTDDPGAPRAVMFGYLNVLLAALALGSGAGQAEVLRLLEDEDRDAFRLEPEAIGWGERRFGTEEIARARGAFATTLGSCSFAEPLRELRELGARHGGPA